MSSRTEGTSTSASLPPFGSTHSTPNMRNRSLFTQDSTTSPTSTTMSESGVSTGFRQTADVTLPAYASAGFVTPRKITIRSDPALLTCFDAADKQLYDLWAPKA